MTLRATLAASLLAATVVAPSCMAQTRMHMPEGSKDFYVTLLVANAPAAEGSMQRDTFLAPIFSAQFANGVFIDMNVVGLHMSDNPEWQYGVQLAPNISSEEVRTAQGWNAKRRFTPEAGGFARFQLAHGVQLRSDLMYGGSLDHRGLRMRLGTTLSHLVAEHHVMGLEFDATLANRSSLHADFSVLPHQAGPGLPEYAVHGGVRDTRVMAFWGWELSSRYTFKAMLWHGRLRGSAARSPRVERAGGVGMAAGVTYEF